MEFDIQSRRMKLIWGAEAIGYCLGITRRRAFYLLETKAIPARKVGGRWVAHEKALRSFFGEAGHGETADMQLKTQTELAGQDAPARRSIH